MSSDKESKLTPTDEERIKHPGEDYCPIHDFWYPRENGPCILCFADQEAAENALS